MIEEEVGGTTESLVNFEPTNIKIFEDERKFGTRDSLKFFPLIVSLLVSKNVFLSLLPRVSEGLDSISKRAQADGSAITRSCHILRSEVVKAIAEATSTNLDGEPQLPTSKLFSRTASLGGSFRSPRRVA